MIGSVDVFEEETIYQLGQRARIFCARHHGMEHTHEVVMDPDHDGRVWHCIEGIEHYRGVAPAPIRIETVNDARDWLKLVYNEFLGLDFHWDTTPSEYRNEDGTPTFSMTGSATFGEEQARAYDVLVRAGLDPYGEAIRVAKQCGVWPDVPG